MFVSSLILDQEENQNEAVVAPQANTNLPNVEDIKRRLGHVLQLVKMKMVKFQLISFETYLPYSCC
jgi:hypothetical protein